MEIYGTLLETKRFSVCDGPGIRTAFYLKGCPLHCLWRHNPESISPAPVIGYYPERCFGCGECAAVCPEHAHSFAEGKHVFNRGQDTTILSLYTIAKSIKNTETDIILTPA